MLNTKRFWAWPAAVTVLVIGFSIAYAYNGSGTATSYVYNSGTINGFSLSYDPVAKTITSSGTETTGSETFIVSGASGCQNDPPNGGVPLIISGTNWSITDSGGATVLTGTYGPIVPDPKAVTTLYGSICSNPSLYPNLFDLGPNTIDVSGLPPGSYTFRLTLAEACVSAGPTLCSIAPAPTLTVFNIFNTGGGGSGGTVNVTSENSVTSTGQLVKSDWNFAGSVVDPCQGNPAMCSGSYVTYTGLQSGSGADVYTLNVSPGAAGAGYSLRSIKQSIAAAPAAPVIKKNPVIAFFENFFNTAHAYVVCGFLNGNASSCPNPASTFVLANTNDTANFFILWDPIADMGPIATPVALSSSAPAKTVSILNDGSLGSTLSWVAGPPVYSGSGGWLTVTPSGAVTGGSSGNSTFTANSAGLPTGSYSATITFTATSAPGAPLAGIPPQTVTVNFSVGAATPVKIISIVPSTNVPVATPITATCSGGSGAYAWTASGPAIFSTSTGANFTFSYSVPSSPTYTLTCTDASDPNSTDSALITVAQVTPACAFAANPDQIAVPQSSTLSWTCVNAVACNIDGTSVNPVAGTFNVAPITDTTYTLFCKGPGNGLGSTASVQATVRVIGIGIIEDNPGGK